MTPHMRCRGTRRARSCRRRADPRTPARSPSACRSPRHAPERHAPQRHASSRNPITQICVTLVCVMNTNPFRFGALALDDAFTDRKDEVAELKADVLNGQDVVVFAPRRYGKSSLVWRAAQELVR